MRIGVAISTTGDEHRLGLLMKCVTAWEQVLTQDDEFVVTVDGDQAAYERARRALVEAELSCSVVRVGQPTEGWASPLGMREDRLGVAANKNTGIEWLMHKKAVTDLFLCDDDTWPLTRTALELHLSADLAHSMVCWGWRRRFHLRPGQYAAWTWPRGSLLYAERHVIDTVGGMVEAFGPGGHEHVEWTRRIHQAGITPGTYLSPPEYADDSWMGAARVWHAEDMARPGESISSLISRRRHLTSVRHEPSDPAHQTRLMAQLDGQTAFVPYAAADNRRWSATIIPT